MRGKIRLTVTVAWWRHVGSATFILWVLAVPSAAQTVGLRAGVSVEPEQFYFGVHVQTPPVVDRLHFRPNLEIGLGNETTIAAFNVEFAYMFRSEDAWNMYAGAGPALNVLREDNDTHADLGFNSLAGI